MALSDQSLIQTPFSVVASLVVTMYCCPGIHGIYAVPSDQHCRFCFYLVQFLDLALGAVSAAWTFPSCEFMDSDRAWVCTPPQSPGLGFKTCFMALISWTSDSLPALELFQTS